VAYTIPAVDRCPVRNSTRNRCALAAGHTHHHVTPGGLHFAAASGEVVTPKLPEPLPAWTGQPFDQWAQDQGLAPATALTSSQRSEIERTFSIVLADQNGLTAKSVYTVSDLLERNKQRADEFAAFKAGVEKTLEHLADQASRHANTLGALGQTCDRLENTLNRSRRAHQNLGETVARHDEHNTELRRDLNRLIGMLGDGEAWNERKQLATLDDVHSWSRRHDRLTLSFSRLGERLHNVEEQGRISAEAIERLEQAPGNHDGRRFERLIKQVQALATENSRLGNRVVELENAIQGQNSNTTIELTRLHNRLSTLEQRFEVPLAWGIKSAEPPRHQTYQDAEGDLWQCRGDRWYGVRQDGEWGSGGDGVTWPFDNNNRKYFPWKVWNGRD